MARVRPLVAPVAVVLLYGQAFDLPATVLALIGMLQAARFIRLWPTNVALGVGVSRIVMINNIARLVALPGAIVGYMILGGLPGVLVGFIFGEFTALIVALVVGVAIGLFQALTQIQEQTLVYAPKIIAIFVSLLLFLPLMGALLGGFMREIAARIAGM